MTSYDWTTLNRSELAAIAAEFDPEAHRGLPFERLVEIIEGFADALPERFVNKKRLAIMQHINDNWDSVSPLIACPAKSRNPRACFGCTDLQVACCVLENVKLFSKDE